MIGTIIGDMAGSRFERHNIKTKEFELLHHRCRPTDDSVMSLAVGLALLKAGGDMEELRAETVRQMQRFGRRYPNAGYGGRFYDWIFADFPQPYGSWANGSAMRAGPCGWAAASLEEALELARVTAAVTHDHSEGIAGAQAVAAAVYMARTGKTKDDIRAYIEENFYALDFTLDGIRDTYRFDVSCRGSVPQAIVAFLEADSLEDAVRGAISIGGDSDTIAAIAGSIAEPYFGVSDDLRREALTYLDDSQRVALDAFEAEYGWGKMV